MVLGLGLLKKGIVGSACAAKGAVQAVTGAAVGSVAVVLNAAKAVVTGGGKGEEAGVQSVTVVVLPQQAPAVSRVRARRVRRCLAAAAVLAPLAGSSPVLYLGAVAAASLALVMEKKEKATGPASTSPLQSLQLQQEVADAYVDAASAGDAHATERTEAPEEGCGNLHAWGSGKRESVSERAQVVRPPAVQGTCSVSARESLGPASAVEGKEELAMGVGAASEELLCEVKEVVAEAWEKVKGECGAGNCEEQVEEESSSVGEGVGETAQDSEHEGGDEGEREDAEGSPESEVPPGRQLPTPISEGAFGKVYKVGTSRALKWMDNVDPEKVKREVGMMVFFSDLCDNILSVEHLELGDTFGGYLMPLCAGTSTSLLKAYRQAYGKPGLPEKWVLQILKQMAEALRVCHARGVCHFDIKPDNILLAQFPCSEEDGVAEGAVKLCDFGEAMEEIHLGGVARPIGTEYYMAPEMLALGEAPKGAAPPIGSACDMFSLGMTALVLLDGGEETGCPWVGEATQQLVQSLLQVDPSQRMTAEGFLSSEWLLKHPLLQ